MKAEKMILQIQTEIRAQYNILTYEAIEAHIHALFMPKG